MATDHDPDRPSLPCFAHELALTDRGYVTFDPAAARDAARWRKAERARLIAERLAVPAEERARLAAEVAAALDSLIAFRPGLVVAAYYPAAGEPDLRSWIASARRRGARIALPMPDGAQGRPAFREWAAGGDLAGSRWHVPVPAAGSIVLPDVVVAPFVGFDRECHRLGRGDGFYDRFLAAADRRPLSIAVGRPDAEVPTIFPQPHDVAMDVVVAGGRVLKRPDCDG